MKYLTIKFIMLSLLMGSASVLSAEKQARSPYPGYFPNIVEYSNWQEAKIRTTTSPSFLSSRKDADTANNVWRLGGDEDEMGAAVAYPDGNGNITLIHGQHYYSQTNPVNLNETHVIGSAGRRKPYAALWRLNDKKLVAWAPSPTKEFHRSQRQLLWDKNQNNVYWYVEENRLVKVTLNFTDYSSTSEVWDQFPEYEYITFGLGSGDFSDDGTKIALIGKQANTSAQDFAILSYLVNEKKITSSLVLNENNGSSLDWASVDPTGQFIVFDHPSKGRSTWVLPFNLRGEPRRLYKHIKHSDFVIDQYGEPWIVFGNWQGVFASQLSGPTLKRVWPSAEFADPETYDGSDITLTTGESASGHISRVSSIAGLVLVSRNKDGGLYFINIDRPSESIYAGNTMQGRRPLNHPLPKEAWGVDIDGEVVSSDGGKDYFREPRASSSSSGKYLFFVSDYHTYGTNYSSGPIPKAYLNMIELSN